MKKTDLFPKQIHKRAWFAENDGCQAVGVALNDLLREYEYLIGAAEADDFRFRVWAD